MDKNVRNLISEAFNELYQEISSIEGLSDKQKIRAQQMIDDAKINGENSKLRHSKPQNEEQQDEFNYVIDKLLDDYKKTKNKKIKSAIQVAFYPIEGSLLYWRMMKANPRANRDEIERVKDAVMSEYTNNFINKFDDTIKSYKKEDRTFGGFVFGLLKKRVLNYLKGYNDDISTKDVVGRGLSKSLETTIGGTEMTIGDKIAGSMSSRFDDEDGMELEKKMLVDLLDWVKNNASEKQYTAFMERVKGSSTKEIAEKYPDLFPDSEKYPAIKEVSRTLIQLKKGKIQNAAKFISDKYDVKFDANNINWKKLKQTISQSSEFSANKSKRTKIDTPEIKEAKKELSDIFLEMNDSQRIILGIKDANDFNSVTKIKKIIQRMMSHGMEDMVHDVEYAWSKIELEKNKAVNYDKNIQFVDDAINGDEFDGMFEGVDKEKLINRVINRLKK